MDVPRAQALAVSGLDGQRFVVEAEVARGRRLAGGREEREAGFEQAHQDHEHGGGGEQDERRTRQGHSRPGLRLTGTRRFEDPRHGLGIAKVGLD